MTSAFHDLAPDEQALVGSWTAAVAGSVHDEVDRRILWLVSRRLTPLAVAEGGWRQLYRDPRDGRLWELTFPHGSLHGGGPRRLAMITREEATEKYGVCAAAP
ncbi:MAG: hypothetical protein DMD35_15315 [Gemmatimonadetes bacterium]|nr:MAG: hypothetical protein DMD35_15315 [Gemmatimonadota bacterium]